jgi:hypothetical protein
MSYGGRVGHGTSLDWTPIKSSKSVNASSALNNKTNVALSPRGSQKLKSLNDNALPQNNNIASSNQNVLLSKTSTAPSVPSDSGAKSRLCCDKCDGEHETDVCPYFKKTRDNHPDALTRPKMGITGLGGTSGNVILKSKSIVVRK